MFKKKAGYTYNNWGVDTYTWKAGHVTHHWAWYYWPAYGCYFRAIRTTQRRRFEIGLKHDYRGAIKYTPKVNIPDAWDDIKIKCEKKSWKRVSRCKKQWMVNFGNT
jgi:hypothetical protein